MDVRDSNDRNFYELTLLADGKGREVCYSSQQRLLFIAVVWQVDTLENICTLVKMDKFIKINRQQTVYANRCSQYFLRRT